MRAAVIGSMLASVLWSATTRAQEVASFMVVPLGPGEVRPNMTTDELARACTAASGRMNEIGGCVARMFGSRAEFAIRSESIRTFEIGLQSLPPPRAPNGVALVPGLPMSPSFARRAEAWGRRENQRVSTTYRELLSRFTAQWGTPARFDDHPERFDEAAGVFNHNVEFRGGVAWRAFDGSLFLMWVAPGPVDGLVLRATMPSHPEQFDEVFGSYGD